jgi:hypothetical protein
MLDLTSGAILFDRLNGIGAMHRFNGIPHLFYLVFRIDLKDILPTAVDRCQLSIGCVLGPFFFGKVLKEIDTRAEAQQFVNRFKPSVFNARYNLFDYLCNEGSRVLLQLRRFVGWFAHKNSYS